MTELADLMVASLGEPRYDSPLSSYIGGRETNEHYVDEDDRVIFHDTVSLLAALPGDLGDAPSFEPGGPRRRIFFPPGDTRVGIVTCGGLCPGLNDVIRGLVMELVKHYGITEITGFRHGFAGLVPAKGLQPIVLTPQVVHDINEQGGTILGSSRGAQDPRRHGGRTGRPQDQHLVRDRRRRLDARGGRHRRGACGSDRSRSA